MFTKALLPDTFRAIQLVSTIPEVCGAYLAGGTALALQIGHRLSVDLDFFTRQVFNETDLSQKLTSTSEFIPDGTAKQTIWGTIRKTKFSMFYYEYPLLEKTVAFEGIQLASLADIAAMKIHAIENRGTRRDFIDVFFLAKTFSLKDMIQFYQKKYRVADDHFYAILRALDYFEDAEQESQMPNMLVAVEWEEVKKFFRDEIVRLWQ